jgi:hypothetical protein
VAIQADFIVILYRLQEVLCVPGRNVIGVRVMAHPAVEFFAVCFRVNALHVFFGDAFEAILVPDIIPFVAVRAYHHGLETQFIRMREAFGIRIRMAVSALKVSVVRPVKLGRVNYIVRVHSFPDIVPEPFVEIAEKFMPMANHAFLVFFNVRRGLIVILGE